jgi:hypothetical protein
MDDYERQRKRFVLAKTLLSQQVDPSIRPQLTSTASPFGSLTGLITQYKLSNQRALEIALKDINQLHLSQCRSIIEYGPQVSICMRSPEYFEAYCTIEWNYQSE